eukprot:c27907_g1_i1 orf=651-3365(+)
MVKNSVKARPTWLYPQVVGYNPSERWGHSSCFFDGRLYVFGGCCGGLHFSDVLALDLKTMAWSSLVTTGEQPGTRDSHSAVLVGNKMVVFGGTNGTKKINDLHILDLDTRNWTQPTVEGTPPSPRESHSATLVGDNRIVIFGGSGEGEGNYLNDVHILDLVSMKWSFPEIGGQLPARRDSHTAVPISNRVIVYGGDCGEHYLGEVDILDLDTFTWSKLEPAAASFPGVRAGHASVAVGNKVYFIGGVGDRAYYNDVWILDVDACTWTKLFVAGPQPQGRFSHSAVLADSNIAIYGGCGEDEHPLDEIVILHLASDYSTVAALSMCKFFANPCAMEHRSLSGFKRVAAAEVVNEVKLLHAAAPKTDLSRKDQPAAKPIERLVGGQLWKELKELNQNSKRSSEAEGESNYPMVATDDSDIAKKRKASQARRHDLDSEQEEHSHSLSQQSSPSQSDQEQSVQKKYKITNSHPTQPLGMFLQQQPKTNADNQTKPRTYSFLHQFPLHSNHQNVGTSQMRIDLQQAQQQQKMENLLSAQPVQLRVQLPHHLNTANGNAQVPPSAVQCSVRDNISNTTDAVSGNIHKRVEASALGENQRAAVTSIVAMPNLVGAEVRGTVDAVFDSGYLMTAQVNGQYFRGLLFSPGPFVNLRDANLIPSCSPVGNGHGGPGILFSGQQCHTHPNSIHQTPGCVNGATLGSSLAPSVHMGTVIQPANWGRSAPIGHTPDNRSDVIPGPHFGAMLKSPALVSEVPRQVIGIHTNPSLVGASKTLVSTRGTADEPFSMSLQSRLQGTAAPEGENCGTAPMIAGSGGQWVWHPFPASAPVFSSVSVNEHSVARRANVHFVTIPPFPVFGFTAPFNNEVQPSIARGGLVQVGAVPVNGAVTDLQAGVTLSLGAPGQTAHSNVPS